MAAERKRHLKNKDYTMYVAISCAIVLFAVVFVLIAKGSGETHGVIEIPTDPSTSDLLSESISQTEAPTAAPTEPPTEAPTEAPTEPPTEAPTEVVTAPPQTDPVVTDPPVTVAPPKPVDPSTLPAASYNGVAYSGPADLSVLSNSVFIGDSRTEGLRIYTSILGSGARVYANKGLSVTSVYTEKFVKSDAGNITALDALRANPNCDSVYIALGINELGWSNIEYYTSRFANLVNDVRAIAPNATIYIEGVLPVTQWRSDSDETFNNTRVEWFNANLNSLAMTLGVKFLNVSEMFNDWGGALPAEASTDGIHLNKEYCVKWLDYIVEHRAN